MYFILDLASELYDPSQPVIYVDEKLLVLYSNVREPLPQNLEHELREDYQYQHLGTLNLFVMIEPKTGQRYVQITKQRRKVDFAYFLEFLYDQYFMDSNVIKLRIVMDNLNTHFPSSLEEHLPSEKAKLMLGRIEWIYTPPHGSWLNMAEIEIRSFEEQVLNQRFNDIHHVISEIQSCLDKRNAEGTIIDWLFTRQEAKELFEEKKKLQSQFVHIEREFEEEFDYETLVDRKLEIEDRKRRKAELKKQKKKESQTQSQKPSLPHRTAHVTIVKDKLSQIEPQADYVRFPPIEKKKPKKKTNSNARGNQLRGKALVQAIILFFLSFPSQWFTTQEISKQFNISTATAYTSFSNLTKTGKLDKEAIKTSKRGRPKYKYKINESYQSLKPP